jgi:hypothetical protein
MLVSVALRGDYIALCCPGHYYGAYAGYDKRAASGVFRLWKTSLLADRTSFYLKIGLISIKKMEGRFEHIVVQYTLGSRRTFELRVNRSDDSEQKQK